MGQIKRIGSFDDYASEIGRVFTTKTGDGLKSFERRRLVNELVLLLQGQLFAPYVKNPFWKNVTQESIKKIVDQSYNQANKNVPQEYSSHLSSLPVLTLDWAHTVPSPKFNVVACNYRDESVRNGRETAFVVNKACLESVGFDKVGTEQISDAMRAFFRLYFEIFPKSDTFNEAILSRDVEGPRPLVGLGFDGSEDVSSPRLDIPIDSGRTTLCVCILPGRLRNLLAAGKENSTGDSLSLFAQLYETFICTWGRLTKIREADTKTEQFQAEVVARCLDSLREGCFLSTRQDYVKKAYNYLVEIGTEDDRIALQKTMKVIYGEGKPYASKLKSYLSLLQGVICFLELAHSNWIWTIPLGGDNNSNRHVKSITMIGDMTIPPNQWVKSLSSVWTDIWLTVSIVWDKAFPIHSLQSSRDDEGKLDEVLKEVGLQMNGESQSLLKKQLKSWSWCYPLLPRVLRITSELSVALHEGHPLRFQGIVGRGEVAKELETVSVEAKTFSNVEQAVSVLKGNYSFLQDEDMAIFIDVDEFPDGLGISKIVRIKSPDNSGCFQGQHSQSDAIRVLTEKGNAFVFCTMSSGGLAQVFAKGKEVFRYRNEKWAYGRDISDENLDRKLLKKLLPFASSWDDDKEKREKSVFKLVSAMLDISNTPGEGTTIILANKEDIAEQFTDMGRNSLFNLGTSKTIKNVGPQVLRQILVMDGATWIDIKTGDIKPRLRLNAVAARDAGEGTDSPPWKQVDLAKLFTEEWRNEWLHRGSRHSSAATLVGACLGKNMCVYVVSSDGGIHSLKPTEEKIEVERFAE